MSHNTVFTAKHIEYGFWLVFSEEGTVRLTRRETDLGRGERAMYCAAKLPRSLFETPVLSAKISVSDPAPGAFNLDIQAAGEALRQAIGVDIDLHIRSAE